MARLKVSCFSLPPAARRAALVPFLSELSDDEIEGATGALRHC